MPSISVIVPVYNVSEYLGECLDSIINQTFSDIEIICVDDGSTDDSSIILKKYAEKDSRIKIITQSNMGLSAARNAGMKIASSDYIIFVDSDDVISVNMCDCFMKNIGDCDIVVGAVEIFGNYKLYDNVVSKKYFYIPNGVFEFDDNIRFRLFVTAWGKMYRKQKIVEYGMSFPDGINHEDISFYWQYVSASKKVSFVNKCLYYYRFRPGSITCKTLRKEMSQIHYIQTFDHIMHTCRKRISDDSIEKIFISCFLTGYDIIDESFVDEYIICSREIVLKYDIYGDSIIDCLRADSDVNTIIDNIDREKSIIYKVTDISKLKKIICSYGIIGFIKKVIWMTVCRMIR